MGIWPGPFIALAFVDDGLKDSGRCRPWTLNLWIWEGSIPFLYLLFKHRVSSNCLFALFVSTSAGSTAIGAIVFAFCL